MILQKTLKTFADKFPNTSITAKSSIRDLILKWCTTESVTNAIFRQ